MNRMLGVVALAVVGGCRGVPPDSPPLQEVTWQLYSNPQVGYALVVPSVYDITEYYGGRTAVFRQDGYPVLAISHVSELEGRRRGLWVGQPSTGPASLGGRAGHRYVYDHYDGPGVMRTLSWVVPHDDIWLGVELRTDADEPDAVQELVLRSLHFLDDSERNSGWLDTGLW